MTLAHWQTKREKKHTLFFFRFVFVYKIFLAKDFNSSVSRLWMSVSGWFNSNSFHCFEERREKKFSPKFVALTVESFSSLVSLPLLVTILWSISSKLRVERWGHTGKRFVGFDPFLSVYRWRARNLSVYRWRETIAVSVIKLFLFGLSVKESKTNGFSVIAKYVGFWELIMVLGFVFF